jgi:hypothetical protein
MLIYRCTTEVVFDLQASHPMIRTYNDLKEQIVIPKKPSPQYTEEEEKCARKWIEYMKTENEGTVKKASPVLMKV